MGDTNPSTSAVLHRDLGSEFFALERSEGNYLYLRDGRKILDASGGPTVGCLGWGNKRVIEAINRQLLTASYCASVFFTTAVQEELCQALVDSTGNHMARAYIVNSGMHIGLLLPAHD